MSKLKVDAARAFLTSGELRKFVPTAQSRFVQQLMRGEEGEWFADKMIELQKLVTTMPKTYETDGVGLEAVVQLHYFSGGSDWYVTEKDCEDEQHQAYGMFKNRMTGETEHCYISIVELIGQRVELDFHWVPKTLAQVMK